MHEEILIILKKHILQILKFVNNEDKEFIYHDLVTDQKISFKDLKGFPCEFFLFLSNKSLCRKYIQGTQIRTDKSQLNPELWVFIHNVTNKWEYFSGDHLYPVPHTKSFNKETYNSGMINIQRKAEGTLWLKEMKELRIEYLQFILFNIDLALLKSEQ